MNYQLRIEDKQAFIREYWQKKPVVIRNAFNHFKDPIDKDELAGLALEEDIDSRIISNVSGNWSVHHGPFDDFSQACKGAWTLLVQGVDGYLDTVKSLLNAFDFVPAWRVDDVMVSFSNTNAGVGPHLDQYDVFIVQGMGTRRWQVGDKEDYEESFPCTGLRQITGFDPIIDEILQPGDMIYIPPGYPHNGVAEEDCLNYSIGFRAPTQQEMLGRFTDFVDENGLFKQRYGDPDLQPRTDSAVMLNDELDKIKQLFFQMIDSPHFSQFVGQSFTALPVQSDYDVELYEQYSPQQIDEMLNSGDYFERSLNLRKLIMKSDFSQDNQWDVWINGQLLQVKNEHIEMLQSLLDYTQIDINTKINYENSLFFNRFVSKLVNTGAFFPVEKTHN